MEILGVPEHDEPRMLMLTQELFGAADPELSRSPGAAAVPGDISSIQAVLADFYQYFATISADRRANPRDDLATVIATSQIDGRPISEFEAMSYYVIVATAGHDLHAVGHGGHAGGRPGDRQGRLADALLRVWQSRRDGV